MKDPYSDQNSSQHKFLVKALQTIERFEQNEQKKKKIKSVLAKFISTKNHGFINKEIDSQNLDQLVQLKLQLGRYTNAFKELTKSKQQYKQYQNIQISQILHGILDKINPKEIKTSYQRSISLMKKEYDWSLQFLKQWYVTVEVQRKNYDVKLKQHSRQKQQKSQKLQRINSQTLLAQSMPNQSQKPIPNQYQKIIPNQYQKSQAQKILQQKNLARLQQKIQQSQKQGTKKKKNQLVLDEKKQSIISKNDDQSSVSHPIHQNHKDSKKKVIVKQAIIPEKPQKPKQPNSRSKALHEYLQKRKQFSHCTFAKLKQLSEFINQNLQKFMKHHLASLIDCAKLRNKRVLNMPQSGNEFNYFSKQGCNLKIPAQIQLNQDPIKILKVNYKSKFQQYSNLRLKQQALENSLYKQYLSRKDDDKKGDKKLWEYLTRESKVERAEHYLENQDTSEARLSIEIFHLRFLFQNHPFIKNTYLMLKCYNQ